MRNHQFYKLIREKNNKSLNKKINDLLKANKIKHIYTYYETKANYAERVTKTIKTEKEALRWIDILSDLTYCYNNSMHILQIV